MSDVPEDRHRPGIQTPSHLLSSFHVSFLKCREMLLYQGHTYWRFGPLHLHNSRFVHFHSWGMFSRIKTIDHLEEKRKNLGASSPEGGSALSKPQPYALWKLSELPFVLVFFFHSLTLCCLKTAYSKTFSIIPVLAQYNVLLFSCN